MKGLLASSRWSVTHPIRETKIDRVADSVWIRVEAGHVRGSSKSLFVIFSFNRTVDQETLTGPRSILGQKLWQGLRRQVCIQNSNIQTENTEKFENRWITKE
uniref:Uncharacterized protein n=1 Tax=Ananas comosus var. bracteatus TaxID=296719 RepID=A0A6V7NJ05_ANACO|nr:unnamed protein product [Ananas comosus var. bracteatus]